MSSFFTLQLDTTPPQLEIYAPNYTTKNVTNNIRIVADENLSQYQEIYIVDSNGDRYDLTFLYDTTEFTGSVIFSDYPNGFATLYTRLKDDVDNFSGVFSKVINILDSITANKLSLSINQQEMGISLDMQEMEIAFDMQEMVVDIGIEE